MTKKEKIFKGYEFEDGKTYIISVDSDKFEHIERVRDALFQVNNKIKWIVISEPIKPIVNPESIKYYERNKQNE